MSWTFLHIAANETFVICYGCSFVLDWTVLNFHTGMLASICFLFASIVWFNCKQNLAAAGTFLAKTSDHSVKLHGLLLHGLLSEQWLQLQTPSIGQLARGQASDWLSQFWTLSQIWCAGWRAKIKSSRNKIQDFFIVIILYLHTHIIPMTSLI